MIYSLVGTDTLRREKAYKELASLGSISVHIYRVKRLEKYSTKVFDAREEKVESATPFALCNAFARRDKKQAWLEWMKLRDTDSAEAIQGALWWKMKTIWEDTKSGKATKFSEKECELFASRIIRASLDAHRGEKDLKVELESIVLSV